MRRPPAQFRAGAPRPLWMLSVRTTREAEEAVAAVLERRYAISASSYSDVETGATSVTVFFEHKPPWRATDRAALAAGLNHIRACGLDAGSGVLRLRKLAAQDWAEAWKRHFHPLEISPALLVKPSWSRRLPKKRQALIVLDPGLSFGTGQHPTTAFCLRELVARHRPDQPQSMLDIGTGSGILAIAAAKLGYRPVHAFDLDPDAIRTARANARQNLSANLIRFSIQNVSRLPARPDAKYDLVCANLIANLLLAERTRIVARVANQGVLVLAGILKAEFAQVQAAYEALGVRLVSSHTRSEWRSGTFRTDF